MDSYSLFSVVFTLMLQSSNRLPPRLITWERPNYAPLQQTTLIRGNGAAVQTWGGNKRVEMSERLASLASPAPLGTSRTITALLYWGVEGKNYALSDPIMSRDASLLNSGRYNFCRLAGACTRRLGGSYFRQVFNWLKYNCAYNFLFERGIAPALLVKYI